MFLTLFQKKRCLLPFIFRKLCRKKRKLEKWNGKTYHSLRNKSGSVALVLEGNRFTKYRITESIVAGDIDKNRIDIEGN